MGSYFPESQRGTTESGWFLGHASPKVFSGASFIPNGTPRFPSKQRSVRTLGYLPTWWQSSEHRTARPNTSASAFDVGCSMLGVSPDAGTTGSSYNRDQRSRLQGSKQKWLRVSRRAFILEVFLILPYL